MQATKSSSILIRLAHSKDRDKIIELEKSVIEHLYQKYNNSQQTVVFQQNFKVPNFNDEIALVAEKDNQIIGFASLLSNRKLVRHLYVRPQFSHHNVASQLLAALEQEAVKKRIDILKVTSSLAERAFYNAQGYQDIAFCHLEKRDILIPAMAMQKRLSFSFNLDWLSNSLLRLRLATL